MSDGSLEGTLDGAGRASTGVRPARARPPLWLALAVAAAALVGVYAEFAYLFPPPEADAPGPRRAYTPPPQRKPGEVELSPNQFDIDSALTVRRPPGGRATAYMGRSVIAHDPGWDVSAGHRFLESEMVRQAILLAAREERGLATRDELLDGTPPAGAGEAGTYEVSSLFDERGTRVTARLLDGKRPTGLIPPALAKGLGDHPEADDYPLRLAALLESMTRSDFPTLLDGIGGRGEPNRPATEGAVPAGVEEKLATLGLVDHLEAARALHRAIREDGESPERLGALARAYAKLAALTAHHWSTGHRAYQARALLYAERLTARTPESPSALRQRAFVRALIGLNWAASADLASAASLDAKAEKPAPPPDWVEPIDAYLKFDRARLEAVQGPQGRLAAFLEMAALEFPMHTRIAVESAGAVLELDPDCGRAFDVIGQSGQLGDRHASTVAAPASFEAHLREKLAAADGLPDAVRKALEAAPPALDAALQEAGEADPAEPSWGHLARISREERFNHVRRRLTFMAREWGVPVGDYWEEARPLVEGHPYRPYLGSLTSDPAEARAFDDFAVKFDASALQPNEFDLIDALIGGKGKPDRKSYYPAAEAHASRTAQDLCLLLAEISPKKLPVAETLLRVSPRTQYAKGMIIRWDWDRIQDKLDDWKKTDGDLPAVQRTLGYEYLSRKRFAEAREWLRRYVQQSPDRAAYEKLAESYEGEGDREGWLAALNDYLEDSEDAGLSHAQVRVQIARYHLAQGRPDLAKPYADEAAGTGAGWAMLCASDVDERLGEWESAEGWARNVSLRYPANWDAWYCFCRRTGRGDLDGARKVVQAALRRPELARPIPAGWFHWIEGDLDKAMRAMEGADDGSSEPGLTTLLVALYDQAGEAEKRDAAFRRSIEAMKDKAPKTTEVYSILLESMAEGKSIDPGRIEAILGSMQGEYPDPSRLILGRLLLDRGRKDEAKAQLAPCARSPFISDWGRAAAGAWLREAGHEVTPPAPGGIKPEPEPAGPTRA